MARFAPTRALLGAVACLLLLVPSCSGKNPTISYETYDRSCQTNADCVLVWSGDVCTCDDVGAISADAAEGYNSERTDLQEDCSSIPKCSTERWRAVCNAGTCEVDHALVDVGDTGGGETGPDTSDTAGGDTAPSDTGPRDTEPSDTAGDTTPDDAGSDGGPSDTDATSADGSDTTDSGTSDAADGQ